MAKRKPDKDRKRCIGRTATGRPCNANPLPGTARCWHHSYKVPGRPSKLTAAIVEQLVDAVRLGAYFETAAQAAGIDKTTLYRWLRRGEDAIARALEQVEDLDELGENGLYDHVDPSEWTYLDFRHSLKSAEAIAELELLEAVRYAPPGAWQQYMTTLERRWPSRWGRFDRLRHEGAVELGKPRVVTPDEERRDRIVALLREAVDRPAASEDED